MPREIMSLESYKFLKMAVNNLSKQLKFFVKLQQASQRSSLNIRETTFIHTEQKNLCRGEIFAYGNHVIESVQCENLL
jgi:acetolactate synthase small subunit